MFHVFRIVVVVALLAVGCGLLEVPAPAEVNPVAVRKAMWLASMIDLEGLKNAPNDGTTPTPAPQPAKCVCPSLCKADFAFPCDCTDIGKCTNPNCRNNPINAKKQELPALPPDPGVFSTPPFVVLPRAETPPPSRMDVWTGECLPAVAIVVVIDDGCAPCRWLAGNVIAPLIATGWRVVNVSRSDNPELAADLKISAVPTVIAFRDGKEVGRMVGAVANASGQLQPQATVDTIAGWFKSDKPAATRQNINGTSFPLPPE